MLGQIVDMLFKDELFEAQWMRTVGHSSSGGAEIGECLAAASSIRETSAISWFEAWYGLAEAILARAEGSRERGCLVSARECYLRASNYFRTAYVFLFGAPLDDRVLDAYRCHRAAFEAAVGLMQPKAERVAIPYEVGVTLHGYLFRAADNGAPQPTLIVTGGYDGTAEELYFYGAAAAVARGLTCVVFDGPGQGAAIIEQGLMFRPDWEAVVKPVVDYTVQLPEVDASKIALLGISLGGYLAPRAASGEPRLAACVADPGQFAILEEAQARVPGFIASQLPAGNAWVLALLEFMLQRRLRHVTTGWALRRGMLVHGADTPLAYLQLMDQYSLKDVVGGICCPTMVCAAEDDHVGATAPKLYDMLTCEKEFLQFTTKEGAGQHCEQGARAVFNQRMFDWLAMVMK